MKRIISAFLALTIGVAWLPNNVINAQEGETKNQDIYKDIVVVYEDEYTLEIIIPDSIVQENPDEYSDLLGIDTSTQLRGPVLAFLGKVAVSVVAGIITHCVVTEWGQSNACYRVMHWSTSPPIYTNNGKMNYKVYGNYTAGKIPGCEPSHSAGCNSGYWTVKYVRV